MTTLTITTKRTRDMARASRILLALRAEDGGPRPGHRRRTLDIMREREQLAVGYVITLALRRRTGPFREPELSSGSTMQGARWWRIRMATDGD